MYVLLILLAACAIVIAAGLIYQFLGLRRDARLYPPPGRLVRAGAQRLHVFEMGEGRPAVVLESGISATCVNWRRVQIAISRFTRVLSYDRAGLGWSDPARTPRTAPQIVEELHAMLHEAAIPAPYVLVGHSFGGLVVRLYAARYSAEVAALVLVDPLRPHEWYPITAEQKRMLTGGAVLSHWGALLARFGVVRFTLSRLASGSRSLPRAIGRATSSGAGLATMERIIGEVRKMPQELWPAIMSHWCHPKSFASMGHHLALLPQSVDCIIGGEPLHGIPVTMIVGAESKTKWQPEELPRMADDLTVITAEHSGHWVQLDEPDLVVDAVRDLVERTRHHPVQPHF